MKQKKAKSILSLDAEKALDFFMSSEQFYGFELPEYFNFDKVLEYAMETVRRRYANTSTGQQMALVCDNWGQYRHRTNHSLQIHVPFLDVEPYKIRHDAL